MKIPLSLCLCLTIPSAAAAEDAPASKKWRNTAELSYIQTSGNSKTSTLSAKDLYNYDWEKTALELAAGGLGTTSRKQVTSEQFNAAEKVSAKLPNHDYLFERTAWEKDRFSGIKERYDLSLGYGRTVLDLPKDKFLFEAGGGYVFEDRIRAENKNFGSAKGYVRYTRTLSPTAHARQDFEYLADLEDANGYRMKAETALTAAVSTHVSLKASYLWRYRKSPTPGFKKADTLNSVSIIVNY